MYSNSKTTHLKHAICEYFTSKYSLQMINSYCQLKLTLSFPPAEIFAPCFTVNYCKRHIADDRSRSCMSYK